MRYKLFIGIIATFCTIGYVQAQSNLYVQMISGDVLYYRLAEEPAVTYTDTELNIKTNTGTTKTIPLNDIKHICYNQSYAYEEFNNAGPIRIYTVSGQYMTTIDKWDDLSELNLPWGIYILRNTKTAQKIAIQ